MCYFGDQQSVLPGQPATRVAYLDLTAAPASLQLGLECAGPAACLAGQLTLLPGVMAAPAQVLAVTLQCVICYDTPGFATLFPALGMARNGLEPRDSVMCYGCLMLSHEAVPRKCGK